MKNQQNVFKVEFLSPCKKLSLQRRKHRLTWYDAALKGSARDLWIAIRYYIFRNGVGAQGTQEGDQREFFPMRESEARVGLEE